jgi:hypothetical protein
MTVPGRKIYFDFKPQKIIGEGATDQGIKDVSTELLETVMKEAINTTLIFFAADIGGSVLKQVRSLQVYLTQFK